MAEDYPEYAAKAVKKMAEKRAANFNSCEDVVSWREKL
jgi:hypothetical protein